MIIKYLAVISDEVYGIDDDLLRVELEKFNVAPEDAIMVIEDGVTKIYQVIDRA